MPLSDKFKGTSELVRFKAKFYPIFLIYKHNFLFSHPAVYTPCQLFHLPGHPLQITFIPPIMPLVTTLNTYCFSPETKYSVSIQKFLARRSWKSSLLIFFHVCYPFLFF